MFPDSWCSIPIYYFYSKLIFPIRYLYFSTAYWKFKKGFEGFPSASLQFFVKAPEFFQLWTGIGSWWFWTRGACRDQQWGASQRDSTFDFDWKWLHPSTGKPNAGRVYKKVYKVYKVSATEWFFLFEKRPPLGFVGVRRTEGRMFWMKVWRERGFEICLGSWFLSRSFGSTNFRKSFGS